MFLRCAGCAVVLELEGCGCGGWQATATAAEPGAAVGGVARSVVGVHTERLGVVATEGGRGGAGLAAEQEHC